MEAKEILGSMVITEDEFLNHSVIIEKVLNFESKVVQNKVRENNPKNKIIEYLMSELNS